MAHQAFRGRIPDDRLYSPEHDMWVLEQDGEVLVGATAFGLFLAGQLVGFAAKPRGAEVARGRGLGTVESRKTVLTVHSPLSSRLLEGNEAAEERPALLNRDPYGEGWMVRALPLDWENERALLVDAAAYRRHVLRVEPEAVFDD